MPSEDRGARAPGAQQCVYEPPDLDAGNGSRVLWKSSKLPRHRVMPPGQALALSVELQVRSAKLPRHQQEERSVSGL